MSDSQQLKSEKSPRMAGNPNPDRHPSSGGKRILPVILAVIVVLSAALFFLRRQQAVRGDAAYVIETLLDEDNGLLNNDRFNTWSKRLDTVRNRKFFQEDLARAFAELVDSGEATNEQVKNVLRFLGKAEYEDEHIRDMAEAYYAFQKEYILYRMDESDPASVFTAAKRMNDAAEDIQNDVNRHTSDFYQISNLYTEAEVRDLFVQAAEAYRDAGDLDHLTDVLSTPLEFRDNGSREGDDDYTAPVSYLDPQEIFDLYAGTSAGVYTILSGQGGYYDRSRGPISVSDDVDYHYGDFFYEAHKKGGLVFDTTEFAKNPGLWDAIGKDLQDYILDTNLEANSSVITCCFRGKNLIIEKPQISALYEAGFEYAVPSKDGKTFVFLSPVAICLDGYTRHVVFGDFSEQYEQLKNFYTGGPVVDAPSDLSQLTPLSQQLENPDPALARFVPYCGVFEGEMGRFVSDFYLSDGHVFWSAAPAEEGGALPFTVSEYGEPVDLYTGPCHVRKSNAYLADADTAILTGSDSNGVQYKMYVLFTANYIGALTAVKTPDAPSFVQSGDNGFNKAA